MKRSAVSRRDSLSTAEKAVGPAAAAGQAPVEDDNPFQLDYARRQVRRFGPLKPGWFDEDRAEHDCQAVVYDADDGVKVTWEWLCGRVDDHLGVTYYTSADQSRTEYARAVFVPVLRVDGVVRASMTPAELQSQWVAVHAAQGRVAIGGLSLGYAAVAMAAQPEVSEVVVFERDARLVDMFRRLYDAGIGRHKVRLINEDVRAALRMSLIPWDMVYMDVYHAEDDSDIAADLDAIWRSGAVHCRRYRFWGQERLSLLLVSKLHQQPPTAMRCEPWDGRFVRYFRHAPRTACDAGENGAEYALQIMRLFAAKKVNSRAAAQE